MEEGQISLAMVISTLENTKMVSQMVKELMYGQMEVTMKEGLKVA